MLLSEAAQLVLQAGAIDQAGEVFLLDMGESVRILDFAQHVARMAGFQPDRDIAIEVVGLRPVERVREELVMEDEDLAPTKHEKALRVQRRSAIPARFQQGLEQLRERGTARYIAGTVNRLRAMATGD